ncbi:MAG: hypothetical protein Q4G50_12355 [Corynebacterium sp.]|uniref:hypothetical protein n=1 Tax=Corynebacterium sp. TaxID=1720 RepID=UPI0026DF3AC2|nr:hypothetical protein [Corynebacterium sp.]MDO5670777.1 hypothetical protein [Corynebacterium sp.]
MEFEEFARQFRQRTTQRMMEFEKALAEAQGRVEKSVRPPTRQQQPTPTVAPAPARRASGRGQVQGLLRKS